MLFDETQEKEKNEREGERERYRENIDYFDNYMQFTERVTIISKIRINIERKQKQMNINCSILYRDRVGS